MEHGDQLRRFGTAFDLDLSDGQILQFQIYAEELLQWNRKINLTGFTKLDDVVVKHFVDSLACSAALHTDRPIRLLDIGAGAGFPGLPLKIALPHIELSLLEPNRKKCAFLHHVIGTLALTGVQVISDTLQNLSQEAQFRGRFTEAITRAVDMSGLFAAAAILLARPGKLILCRTRPFAISHLPHGFELQNEIVYELPGNAGHRVLSILRPA